MKKFLSFIFVAILGIALVACGGETDEDKVKDAKDNLKISFTVSGNTLTNVTGDLTLVSKQNGVDVTWVSSNLEVVGNDGKVVLPEEETQVELTATLKLNEVTDNKKFNIIVKPEETGNGDDVDLVLPNNFNGLANDKPVYITSIGQSGDLATLNTLLGHFVFGRENEAEFNAQVKNNSMLTAGEVPTGSIVILVPGASNKGLGAAGTNLANEKARAEAFNARAAAGEITVIVVHIGGEARRGSDTDPLITASVSDASIVMIEVSGNGDNFFTNLNLDNLYVYSTAQKMTDPFKQVFDR